jgi:hypothetical protein
MNKFAIPILVVVPILIGSILYLTRPAQVKVTAATPQSTPATVQVTPAQQEATAADEASKSIRYSASKDVNRTSSEANIAACISRGTERSSLHYS